MSFYSHETLSAELFARNVKWVLMQNGILHKRPTPPPGKADEERLRKFLTPELSTGQLTLLLT